MRAHTTAFFGKDRQWKFQFVYGSIYVLVSVIPWCLMVLGSSLVGPLFNEKIKLIPTYGTHFLVIFYRSVVELGANLSVIDYLSLIRDYPRGWCCLVARILSGFTHPL